MTEKIKEEVIRLLNNDNSGHGTDHIDRVLKLSLAFAKKEHANEEITAIIALLHDVDDYKLFGTEHAEHLTNAKRIMHDCHIQDEIQEQVCLAISQIGYGKRLKGCCPTTLEGKVVSDADMCDALGVNGILRAYTYSLKHGKSFFDRNMFPIENIAAQTYTTRCSDSTVCHIFEKMLKLKDMMLTQSGMEEAKSRHQITVEVLYHLFDEEDAPEWAEYLTKHL